MRKKKPPKVTPPPADSEYSRLLRAAERQIFLLALPKCAGNMARMAEWFGISRQWLAQRIKHLDLVGEAATARLQRPDLPQPPPPAAPPPPADADEPEDAELEQEG